MLVVLAGCPCAAPLEACLSEELIAEVRLVNLVRESPVAFAEFGCRGWLHVAGAVSPVLIVGVVESVDVYGKPAGVL